MKFIPSEFEIPFYKISCSNWKSKKDKFRSIIKNCEQSFIKQEEVLGVLNTTYDRINFSNEITNILFEEIKIFEKQSSLNVKPSQAWFQVYNYGNEHPIHNHGGLGYSCVVFINFLKDLHKPTSFLPPFHDILGEYKIFTPDVSEGDILFFPASIPHYAPSNQSQISRIIASINFEIERQQ